VTSALAPDLLAVSRWTLMPRVGLIGSLRPAVLTRWLRWLHCPPSAPRSAKASGYWTKLNRVNLFCGNQLAAALIPLKVGLGSATETNVNFVSGDYTEATGLTGNGSTKYLNTGLLATGLTLNDTHLAVYNRSSAAGNSTLGCLNGTDRLTFAAPFTDSRMYSDMYDSGSGRVSSAGVIGTPNGFLVASRTASNSHAVYRNGASVNSNATSGGALPAANVFVFAYSNAGAPNGYTSNILAGYSIGSGLSAAEVAAYNTHMEAFQDALNRGVA
jgi:hypothetical protein